MSQRASPSDPATPWWRVRMLWLVLAGPAVVVVAGIVTAVIAVHGADTPLATQKVTAAETMAPATQARNHVVTP